MDKKWMSSLSSKGRWWKSMHLKMLFSKIDLRNNLKWLKIKLKTKYGICIPCWLKYKLLLTTFERNLAIFSRAHVYMIGISYILANPLLGLLTGETFLHVCIESKLCVWLPKWLISSWNRRHEWDIYLRWHRDIKSPGQCWR